jgi:hypothetical protein
VQAWLAKHPRFGFGGQAHDIKFEKAETLLGRPGVIRIAEDIFTQSQSLLR